jgi:hypothetical protein
MDDGVAEIMLSEMGGELLSDVGARFQSVAPHSSCCSSPSCLMTWTNIKVSA